MRTSRCFLVAAALAASALAIPHLAGCKSSPARAEDKTPASPLNALAGDWSLATLQGTDAASLRPADARHPTLKIEPDGRISGSSGINRYASSLDTEALAQGRFALSPTIGTKMGASPEAMRFETMFLQALNGVTRFELAGPELVLMSDTGEVMRFARSAP